MTFPPLKSMYLLRGTLIAVAIWFGVGMWLTSRAPDF